MTDTPRPYGRIIDDLVEASKSCGYAEECGTSEQITNSQADVAFYRRELVEYIERLARREDHHDDQ